MPTIFSFQQGSESRLRPGEQESSPLLGRFRAIPSGNRRRGSSVNDLFSSLRRSALGYEVVTGGEDEAVGVDSGTLERPVIGLKTMFVEPTRETVQRGVEWWWGRWMILIVLPAAIVVSWCALPFPTYDIRDGDDLDNGGDTHRSPKGAGHGQPLVELNFWFFLFAYYGFYNCVGLVWMTKLFNIYSLNWWPKRLGFPVTMTLIIALSLVIPIPIYYIPFTKPFMKHNIIWILLTFCSMLMPVLVAFGILLKSERHLSLRKSLSETQRMFTSSWWIGETWETVGRRNRQRHHAALAAFEADAPLQVQIDASSNDPRHRIIRKRWIPASFVRFIWFCLALFIGLLCYVFGEVYAEVYLRTLPHNNIETLIYVWSWVVTVHLLDGITGWIVGGEDGERVGSYPLGWVFKLYFMLTYQTFVRALYARLRSPGQFIFLQAASSTLLVLFTPLSMTRIYHRVLVFTGINGQTYTEYKKFVGRSFFLRGIAENVSMLAFLGEVAVLHYGSNKDIYPYLSFVDPTPGDPYNFSLTFWASAVTWACEIFAGWVVRRWIHLGFGFNVTGEGKRDLVKWPELVPASTTVMIHVLQNMLFSIIRLKFR